MGLHSKSVQIGASGASSFFATIPEATPLLQSLTTAHGFHAEELRLDHVARATWWWD